MTGMVTSTNTFNATQSTTLYVEGTEVDEGSIALNWQKNAASAPQLMDTVYYNVWKITGAQNVPGNGKYTYSVQLPTKISAVGADWSVPNSADVPVAQANPANIAVVWSSGPEVGSVDYSPVSGFIGQWNVNVVQIQVTAGTVTSPTNVKAQGTLGGGYLQVYTGTDTFPADDVIFSNSVTVTGPTGGWGDSQLTIGYIQEASIVTMDATYQDGTTQKSNLDGQTYTDWANGSTPPWSDSTLTPGGSYVAYFQPTSNGSQLLKHYDSPKLPVPATDQTGSSLQSTNIFVQFTKYVAAETDDTANGANQVYVGLAEAHWQINYEGTMVNGAFNPSAPQAITSDTSFSLATYGNTFPITITSTSANQAVGSESWNQINLPIKPKSLVTAGVPNPNGKGRKGEFTIGNVTFEIRHKLAAPPAFSNPWIADAAWPPIVRRYMTEGFSLQNTLQDFTTSSLLGEWPWVA